MPEMHSTHGTIWALFGHRLALEGPDGRILIDLGPDGATALAGQSVILKVGDAVAVTGETKPTEIRATAITGPDGIRHAIVRPSPAGKDAAPADPATALAALRQAGYQLDGEPARKPKHFEVRARKDGVSYTAHVTFAGVIRKAVTVADSTARVG